MMIAKVAESNTAAHFPASEIESCIRDFLAEEATMQAELRGSGETGTEKGATLGPQPVIDSLVVVEVLIELEPMIPFPLPESLIRAGGYDSVDVVVTDLVPQLQRRWRKQHGEKS